MPLNETFHGLIAWHSFSPEARRPAAHVRHLRTRAARAPDVHQRDHTGEAIGELPKDSRCITAAWTARSIAICWKPTVSKWCDMSSGMRNAAARMSGWPGVAAPSRARRVAAHHGSPGRDQVAVDEVLRIPDEPGEIQPFSLAGLDGQAPVRGSRRAVQALCRGRWPAAVVHVGAPGRGVRRR